MNPENILLDSLYFIGANYGGNSWGPDSRIIKFESVKRNFNIAALTKNWSPGSSAQLTGVLYGSMGDEEIWYSLGTVNIPFSSSSFGTQKFTNVGNALMVKITLDTNTALGMFTARVTATGT